VQHVRQVVSKYGGMIETGSTVYVPPQPWERRSPRLTAEAVAAYKSKPNLGRAGAIVTDDQAASRKDGYMGRAGSTNNTLCEEEPSFRSRAQPTATVVQAGVPGYQGHVPHGVGIEPHVVKGRENHTPQVDNFATFGSHKSLDQSRPHIPRAMPVPGYAGHMHKTHDSYEQYGTSRWQPTTPISHTPKILTEDHHAAAAASGWPLSSGVADQNPIGGRSAAGVASRYEKTIATLGKF